MADVPGPFRARLKRELPEWVGEGILTEEQARRLSDRYKLDELGREASSLLVGVILCIGGLLVGGGVIAFVAAHWDSIPTALKVAMLFIVLLGFHGAGGWLWYAKGRPLLGHALVFTGCLAFGACIGLMAQIFHVKSDGYTGFAAWAVGALAVAWATRSSVIGALAMVTSFVWFCGFFDRHEQEAVIYPFLIAGGILTLASLQRSRLLHFFALSGLILSMCMIAGKEGDSGHAVLLAMAAGGLLAWAEGEFHRLTGKAEPLAGVSTFVGLLVLAGAAYVWSFAEVANDRGDFEGVVWWIPLAASALASGVLLFFAWQARPPTGIRLGSALAVLASALLLGASGLLRDVWGEVITVLLANAVALALACTALAYGLSHERRGLFWCGTLYLVILVLSRFLEYDTGLLLKSAAFIASGAAMLFAGVKFEQRLRAREAARGSR